MRTARGDATSGVGLHMTRRDQPDPVTKAPEARGPNGALTDTFRFRPDRATTRQCILAPFEWLMRLRITPTPAALPRAPKDRLRVSSPIVLTLSIDGSPKCVCSNATNTMVPR